MIKNLGIQIDVIMGGKQGRMYSDFHSKVDIVHSVEVLMSHFPDGIVFLMIVNGPEQLRTPDTSSP